MSEDNCPRVRPSDRARPDWSTKATELLAGARRAQRQYRRYHDPEAHIEWKTMKNNLKREMRKNSKTRWRKLLEELTGGRRPTRSTPQEESLEALSMEPETSRYTFRPRLSSQRYGELSTLLWSTQTMKGEDPCCKVLPRRWNGRSIRYH